MVAKLPFLVIPDVFLSFLVCVVFSLLSFCFLADESLPLALADLLGFPLNGLFAGFSL